MDDMMSRRAEDTIRYDHLVAEWLAAVRVILVIDVKLQPPNGVIQLYLGRSRKVTPIQQNT